jgi:hypothetical protein
VLIDYLFLLSFPYVLLYNADGIFYQNLGHRHPSSRRMPIFSPFHSTRLPEWQTLCAEETFFQSFVDLAGLGYQGEITIKVSLIVIQE